MFVMNSIFISHAGMNGKLQTLDLQIPSLSIYLFFFSFSNMFLICTESFFLSFFYSSDTHKNMQNSNKSLYKIKLM